MNVRSNEAGYVTHQDFLDLGFKIFDTIDGNDMGQCSYSMPQWVKDKIEIT